MIVEYGKRVEGEWKVVTTDVEEAKKINMKPDTVYEYEWDVKSTLPLPSSLDKLRKLIIAKVAEIQKRIEGLNVLWWKITDDKFNMQVVRKQPVAGNTTVETIALSMVAILAQGVFLAAGIWLVFASVKELIKKAPERIIPPVGLSIAIALGGIFILSHIMKPKPKEG